MRVIVCGGGIGGLTLAQALRDDCDVTVVERDAEAVQTGGYRLAINGPATAVLERHLDAGLLSRIRAASDGAARFAQFTIATDRLRPLVIAREDAGEGRLLAQRRALRLLLTEGLGSRIRWSARVRRVEQFEDGAAVHLDTGERLEADLVVGAEGAYSPTVRAVTSADLSTDLRLTGMAGSAPRRPGAAVPRFLRRGPALAFAGDGTGMFLSLTSVGTGPLSADVRQAVGPASLVWGLIAPAERVGDTAGMTAPEMVDTALRVTRRWHPWMRRQIESTLHDRTAAFAFRAADPTRDLTPWRPRNITALGDAIHAMPPTGGQAASTAILDAGELAQQVRRHLRGEIALDDALARYHQRLTDWALPALRESLGPVRVIRALGNPAVSAVARPALRLAELFSPARAD